MAGKSIASNSVPRELISDRTAKQQSSVEGEEFYENEEPGRQSKGSTQPTRKETGSEFESWKGACFCKPGFQNVFMTWPRDLIVNYKSGSRKNADQ